MYFYPLFLKFLQNYRNFVCIEEFSGKRNEILAI